MIQVDISNVWCGIEFADLMRMEQEVFAAHAMLADGTGEGSEFRGWMDLLKRDRTLELERIQAAAEKIRSQSQAVVVVGIGGSCLGAKAAIDLLQGPNRNLHCGEKGNPQIFFAGDTLSTRAWNDLCSLLDGRDFSVIIISKSGTTTEPAIAIRALRRMLEDKYGAGGARERIYAVTDPVKGALRQMAEEEGWQSFSIPQNVGGRYSVLTAVGLLPMAAAGIDIAAMAEGAAQAIREYDLRSFENPVWLYAAVRNLLYRRGKTAELLCGFEPGFRNFGLWWQHLFAESEGKEGKGLLPVCAQYPADLHSLGQMIQQGERNLFETVFRFEPPLKTCTIARIEQNRDGLNYLAGRTLDDVEEKICLAAIDAHVDGGVPALTVDCGALDGHSLGALFYFLELTCAISGYILGVNPFNQPGVEKYKRNMFALLGKPGYETN